MQKIRDDFVAYFGYGKRARKWGLQFDQAFPIHYVIDNKRAEEFMDALWGQTGKSVQLGQYEGFKRYYNPNVKSKYFWRKAGRFAKAPTME